MKPLSNNNSWFQGLWFLVSGPILWTFRYVSDFPSYFAICWLVIFAFMFLWWKKKGDSTTHMNFKIFTRLGLKALGLSGVVWYLGTIAVMIALSIGE